MMNCLRKSVTSTLFTFKCWIGLAEGFPAILRTIVQTFFIEVRLLYDIHNKYIDCGYKGLPGFAFSRFYSVPGFGPDDTEIFYISRGRADFYFSSSFSSTTDGIDAFIV